MNCPDFSYGTLLLDGRGTYRLHARYGDTRILLLQVMSRPFGQPGSTCTGNYEYRPWLEGAGQDGEPFEIILSAQKQPGNWVPLDGDSKFNFLMIRRALGDWYDDPGEVRGARGQPRTGRSRWGTCGRAPTSSSTGRAT
jgi:hypothetical protein